MPSEVMKWRNHFCDDVMIDANLWDRNFPFATLHIDYTTEFRELSEVTTT